MTITPNHHWSQVLPPTDHTPPPPHISHRYCHLMPTPTPLPPRRPQVLPPNDHTTQYTLLCDLSIYCKRVFLSLNCGITDNVFSRLFAKLYQGADWRSFIGAEISPFLCFGNNFTCFSLGWLMHWKRIARMCSGYFMLSFNWERSNAGGCFM